MRLFAAIEISQNVGVGLERLQSGVANARWIGAENFHLTLAFIGEADSHLAAEIDTALADVQQFAFDLQLSGVGAFGGARPRALWAGIHAEPALFDLQANVARALTRSGVQLEKRKFSPHVTLARLRHAGVGTVAAYLARCGDYRSENFEVNRFVLMSSKPSKGGGPYVTERIYPLLHGLDDALDDIHETW